jgi:hypothetical protein
MFAFQMELNDYPYFYLIEDMRLSSTGQHCPGFPRVLYDALLRRGYDGDAMVYHCWLSMAHSLDRCEVSVMILFKHTEPYMCEVSVMIPFEHTEPWSGSIIGNEPDPGVEMMEHIALTSPCEDRLAATAALTIVLLPI